MHHFYDFFVFLDAMRYYPNSQGNSSKYSIVYKQQNVCRRTVNILWLDVHSDRKTPDRKEIILALIKYLGVCRRMEIKIHENQWKWIYINQHRGEGLHGGRLFLQHSQAKY